VIRRNVSFPAWSSDGSRFVYYGARGFYVAASNGRGARLVYRADCGSGSDNAWSRDGSRLALACTSDGEHSRIVVIRPDGTKATRVRVASGMGGPQLGGLAWAPGGKALAFYETRLVKSRGLVGQLATVAPDGSRLRKLASIRGFVALDERPSWRRDGRTIAFRKDGRDFALLDVRTRRVTRVMRGFSPEFSPDGRRLAFSREGEHVARADGTGEIRVADGVLAVWSPDSKVLAYLVRGPRVALVGADGRNSRTLTRRYADMLDLEWRR
jgi:Tol biopolymer transport system component